LYFIWFRLN